FDQDDAAVAPFQQAARALGVPLNVIRAPYTDGRERYEAKLILVRPDQYVVWTGDTGPDDARALLAKVVGRGCNQVESAGRRGAPCGRPRAARMKEGGHKGRPYDNHAFQPRCRMSRDDPPTSVHLVGSIGIDTVEEVFRTVGGLLGPYLRRIPDGE